MRPKTMTVMTIRIPIKLKGELKDRAWEQRRTLTQYVIEMIQENLNKTSTTPPTTKKEEQYDGRKGITGGRTDSRDCQRAHAGLAHWAGALHGREDRLKTSSIE